MSLTTAMSVSLEHSLPQSLLIGSSSPSTHLKTWANAYSHQHVSSRDRSFQSEMEGMSMLLSNSLSFQDTMDLGTLSSPHNGLFHEDISLSHNDDGFQGAEMTCPSHAPDSLSLLVDNGSLLINPERCNRGVNQDNSALNGYEVKLLPFELEDAHSPQSDSWSNTDADFDSGPEVSPLDLIQHCGTSPVGGSYFLQFGNECLNDNIDDLLTSDIFAPMPHGADADSAYHSSPSSPGAQAKHQSGRESSTGHKISGKTSSQDDGTKRRKSSPSECLQRRPSGMTYTSEVKSTGQYRGMSQRDAHNAMERERRIQLRENFESLRSEVPSLRDADKAATLQILREATTYIKRMRDEEKQLVEEKAQLLSINEALRKNATVIHDNDDSDVPPLLAPPS